MGKVVTREWRKAKSAELEFAFISAFRDNSSFGLNIPCPLCLWQCFRLKRILGLTMLPHPFLEKSSDSVDTVHTS